MLPVRSGTSKSTGNEWKALPFIFEYFETPEQRWSDKVLLETMDTNIMAQIGAYLKKGADGKAVVENDECVLMYELKCRVGFSHTCVIMTDRTALRERRTISVAISSRLRGSRDSSQQEILLARQRHR